jgi:hypothetical protein
VLLLLLVRLMVMCFFCCWAAAWFHRVMLLLLLLLPLLLLLLLLLLHFCRTDYCFCFAAAASSRACSSRLEEGANAALLGSHVPAGVWVVVAGLGHCWSDGVPLKGVAVAGDAQLAAKQRRQCRYKSNTSHVEWGEVLLAEWQLHLQL